jgi:predicted O-methyltransferase YrrM
VKFGLPAGFDGTFEKGAVYLGDREDSFIEHAVLAELAVTLGWPAPAIQLWKELFTTSLTGMTPAMSHVPASGGYSELERLLLTQVGLLAGQAGGDILDVGTAAGNSTHHLALGLKLADATGRLWTAPGGTVGRTLAANILSATGLDGYVHQLASGDDAALPAGLRPQIIMVHGDQGSPLLAQQRAGLADRLAKDGIMVVCNYRPESPGVMQAVQRQLFESHLRVLAQVDFMILLGKNEKG